MQAIFARDGYESRRSALPSARLVKVLVLYQMIGTKKLRGLIRTITEHAGLQTALGGTVALNTLSNGLAQREVVQEWGRGIPHQLVVTPGKVHDLRGAARLYWARHWTYTFDRAYLGL